MKLAFMRISARNLRIGGSVVIAVLMVAAGYVLPGFSFPKTKPVNAALTDDLLANYVSKDSDSDGLPDWQESLYGTDPNKADTDGDGISDGDAVKKGLLTPTALASQVPNDPAGKPGDLGKDLPGNAPTPGSLTDQFAHTFFQQYIETSNGGALTQDQQDQLVTQLLGEYTRAAAQSLDSHYTLVSVHTDPSVSTAVYVGNVEQILDVSIPNAPDMDMYILAQNLIQDDDAAAGKRLTELGTQYMNASKALLAMQVPPALAPNHLQLVQGLEQAGRGALALSNYKKDPLLTMGALTELSPSRDLIVKGFSGIAGAVVAAGEPGPGAPGYELLQFVRNEQQR